MDKRATIRSEIHPGQHVAIVLKKDQPTGQLTEGTVKRILTNSPEHHRGIKVMLQEDDLVGRVQLILGECEKELVGTIDDGSGSVTEIYSSDMQCFTLGKEDGKKTGESLLQEWAVLLNSPWTAASRGYDISPEIKKGGDVTGRWQCGYYTIGYEGIYASVYGYGSTPEEAIRMSKLRMQQVQRNYNPERKKY